ncbi:MAG: ABC transporter permease subunit [Anaerolineae bacterium]|nr:ABC transporter permease subunit [Anaerolineae bacterium]
MTQDTQLPGDRDVRQPARAASAVRRGLRGAMLFAAQRLGFGALVVVAIVYLSYLGLDMAGGADLGRASSHAVAETAIWARRLLLQGDLGHTTAGSDTVQARPVAEVVVERLPRSLGLLSISLTLAALAGVGLGILAARSSPRGALLVLLSTLVGVSLPSFFVAFLLQWGAIAIARSIGRSVLPVGGFGWDRHLVLPVLVLSARPLAQITRIAFVSVRRAMGEDYVRTAHSKGLHPARVMAVHVLRNAAIPVLTTVAVSLRYALSSLPVVELYFGWTGVGFTLLKGISQRDDNLTVALAVCLGTFFVLVNLVLEVAYRLIDPRLRETPSFVRAGSQGRTIDALRAAAAALGDLMAHNALATWIRRRYRPEALPPLPWRRRAGDDVSAAPPASIGATRRWNWAALRNLPLLAGGLLVLALAVAVFLGPRLAPHDTSHTEGLIQIDGQFASPPFAPGETYPWGTDALGRDLMSLILAGARQTLTLVILAVATRLLVGILLGGIAGWTNGSRLDRAILALADVIAAFPTLLLAMILILALGIRRGISSFVAALCFVGWGEIMQFVRAQVTAIRPQPFVESAVAAGARTPRILARHILPQLVSALTSIAALEMGAVLMLLGELGFVSVFIGGGTLIAQTSGQLVLHSDVPEWGAMLSNLRYMARSYPWTALYPMLAFSSAILAFNLFGEGMRRLLERGQLYLSRRINQYLFALLLVGAIALRWITVRGGVLPYYQRQAEAFDGERAYAHVVALTDPAMQGRALGSDGVDRAAAYIADQFESLQLQSAGQEGSYYQHRAHAFERIDGVPVLQIEDGGPPLAYRDDYALLDSPYTSKGTAQGSVRFVCLGEQLDVQGVVWRLAYPELDRADYRGEVLLTLSQREAEILNTVPHDATLVVAHDPLAIARRATIGGRLRRAELPRLWVSQAVAERLLLGSGYSLAGLRRQCAALPGERVLELALPVSARASAEGELLTDQPVRHVIGYLPGTHSYDYCVDCLGKQLIVVMAQYDSPPMDPDSVPPPAANVNASGVAVMLEAVRVIQSTDYEPYKSMLFVAYSGEGLDAGEYVVDPDVARFLQARAGLSSHEVEAIIRLQGVGGATGRRLEISASGSLRLAELVGRAARPMGTRVTRARESIDLSVIYDERGAEGRPQEAPTVRLCWEGWERHAWLATDTLDNVSADHLERAGRTLALTLMILGRERDY